ncbi:arrestin domain-containing protein 3 [Anastrepha obliqua]|uniref:arrestin domain-containing protein 3 n=1 Tax=Anastrepha obliqua TaxID=95512 RepID=UPI002409FDE8|nr:arrestin domain-containing protein 3 [Anastrepha obliqua]
MSTSCQFKFSRNTPIYYSGEQITGSIILSTTKQLPVEAIQLSLVGTERVQWLEKSRGASLLHNDSIERDNKELYSGKQEHLCESYTLAKCMRLQAGEVRVEEFCFTLPHDAPASCEMLHGEVGYCVRLVLQRKSVFNKVFTARIVVKNRLDLSDAAELVEPQKLTITSAPSNIHEPLHFSLPTGTGYVPGQTISYTLHGRHIFASCTKLRVNLYEASSFRATSPQKKTKEFLKLLKSDAHKICSSYVMVCGRLNIPLMVHISLRSNENSLIQISHYVEAVLINKKRILHKFIIPIVIGTVPPKRKQLMALEKSVEEVDNFYCYDNLATDAVCDRSTENSYLITDYHTFLPKLSSALLCDTWATPETMLQQHVATRCS